MRVSEEQEQRQHIVSGPVQVHMAEDEAPGQEE